MAIFMKQKTHLRETIRYMWYHAHRRLPAFVTMLVLISIAKICDVITSVYYKNFIDTLTAPHATPEKLYPIIWGIFILFAIPWVCWRIVEFTANFWQPDAIRQIGEESYHYLQQHAYNFFINNFVGSLVKRLNRLPTAFETVTDIVMFNLFPTFVLIAASMVAVYNASPLLALVLGIFCVVFISANYGFAVFMLRYDNKVNALDTKWSGFVADTIANNMNIQLFSSLPREFKSFQKITMDWRKLSTFTWNLKSVGNAVQASLMMVTEIGFLVIGTHLWSQGKLTAGDFVLFENILISIFINIWDLGRNIRKLGKGLADGEEMIAMMCLPHEIVDNDGAQDLKLTHGEITIKDLTFTYEKGRTIFEDFDLNIPAKRKVAFVSRSGEGKSTLTKLIMRLYNIPEGTVFIDDQDIMNVTLESLRKSISFVPQDPILFHRTLAGNIKYGRPHATMDEVIEASKKAHCHEFISRLPEGYNTFVGERGVKLSGGERQRVAIARAILEDCPILILDEATSSLDSESEHLIQDALTVLMKNKTSIVIAHRLSTINQMDEIIVIEKGKITERGTHNQLLKKEGGHYRMLWEIQSGGYDE
jgi:ATP-binding cassette subfamily B protein